ncbi:glycerate kinase [Haloarculaceae archaeon H-GB11]|nr:glycerate kinase [Haloarculaceae archaeon H-GB11]
MGHVVIRDRNALATSDAHATALACVEAGIAAADPEAAVRERVSVEDGTLWLGANSVDLDSFESVIVLGGGKAAASVAAGLEAVLGDRIDDGVVVTSAPEETTQVSVVEASHPVPDERGVAGARRVEAAAREADADTLVLAVVTGGASALLPAPVDGVDLTALRETTTALLESGAPITDVNAVRKHLSRLKGGGLARAAAPARVSTLVVSDVVGDDLGVIASGPTAPDPTTFADALDVLERFEVTVPDAVRSHLSAGAAGERAETPGPDDSFFDRVTSHVLANGRTALDAARAEAEDRGYDALVLSASVRGEAREQGLAHLAIAEEVVTRGDPLSPPAVVLSGGETTVTVHGDGEGGPNQEFALRAALELPAECVLTAVDTDGVDGGTDAAGALVDGRTVTDPETAREALDANDAYGYLDARNALLRTGPTGTNVNDLRVLVVD